MYQEQYPGILSIGYNFSTHETIGVPRDREGWFYDHIVSWVKIVNFLCFKGVKLTREESIDRFSFA